MKSVQKFALMMCVVIVLTTFGALALARAEGCTVCEKGVMRLKDSSEPYDYDYDFVYCSKTGLTNDTKVMWYVDELWACSNSRCNNHYTDTRVFKYKIECSH